MVLCIPSSMTRSGGCTRVSGVERMLIENIGHGKIHEKFPEIYVSEICGIRDAFFVLLYGVTIGRNVYASQLQSGINDETALTSSVVWQFADQYDYGEIDETLKELFPRKGWILKKYL